MPAVTRIGDNCTGHGCFPPRPSIAGSGNVFVKSKAVHRQAATMADNRFNTTVHITDYDTFGFENQNLHNH